MKLPIRRASSSDTNLILHSWLHSVRGCIPYSQYGRAARQKYKMRVNATLITSEALVACDPQDPDLIYGWIVYSDDALHFIWTRATFRRMKIATNLIREAFNGKSVPYTATTKIFSRINPGKVWGLGEFDPYLIEVTEDYLGSIVEASLPPAALQPEHHQRPQPDALIRVA